MSPRTRNTDKTDDKAPATAPAAPAAPTFAVAQSTRDLKREVNRDSAPNPLTDALRQSLDNGNQTLEISVADKDAVKLATGFLRRAATELNCGLRLKHFPEDNVLAFRADKRRNRAYTAADIRKWAAENGYGESDLTPKISETVRAAFKTANGYDKNSKASDDK